MSDTRTIDAIIRERARKESDRVVRDAFAGSNAYLGSNDMMEITFRGGYVELIKDGDHIVGVKMYHGEITKQLMRLAQEREGEKQSQAAVERFLSRVDQLGEEIDELRSQRE